MNASEDIRELSLPGLVACDERVLQEQIFARAKSKSLSGVSTTASLKAIVAVQRANDASLSSLRGKHSAASAAEEQEWALKRDVLRIRGQLLQKLVKIRESEAALSTPSGDSRKIGEQPDLGLSVLASVEALKQPPLSMRSTAVTTHAPVRSAPSDSGRLTSNAVEQSECPVCQDMFSAEVLERHIDRCLRRAAVGSTAKPGVRVRNTSTAKADAATDDMFDDEATFDEATSADAHGCEPSMRRSRSDETSEKKLLKSKQRATVSAASSTVVLDDWDDDVFQRRQDAARDDDDNDCASDEGSMVLEDAAGPSSAVARTVTLPHGLVLPRRIHRSLLPYQITGVQWLWALHRRGMGGILGDEMGLGKTVQVAALFGALHTMGLLQPSLIVCPATVVAHWIRELTTWHPQLRVIALHASSSRALAPERVTARQMISAVIAGGSGHILVTTYEGLRVHQALLIPNSWSYVVLDEGHRIKNSEAAVTVTAKQLHSIHRLVLTGGEWGHLVVALLNALKIKICVASSAPIQNRLSELWSIFDFVLPGRLGDLPLFEANFAHPIAAGGWSHASPLQLATAHQTALVLRDTIGPFLLRRLKRDVNSHLPSKTEQVLFCRITATQRSVYQRFLQSRDVTEILQSRAPAFRAIMTLRKICNHPGLVSEKTRSSKFHHVSAHDDDDDDVDLSRRLIAESDVASLVAASGKLIILVDILRLWYANGNRCLIFCQGRQMLDIVQAVVSAAKYDFLRMDGTTSIRQRQVLVDKFNSSDGPFAFLLTTRVGGVGVNLVGADRVIIVDPDWNPATDLQARERAWRLGQKRHVAVYRLISTGTIEEKIYQRQVFKMAMTSSHNRQRVLSDPSFQRVFNQRDLQDLFTLSDASTDATHTHAESDTPRHSKIEKANGSKAAQPVQPADNFSRGISSFLTRQEAYVDPDAVPNDESESDGDVEYDTKKRDRRSHDISQTAILQALFGQGPAASSLPSLPNNLSSSERSFINQHATRVARQAAQSLPSLPNDALELTPLLGPGAPEVEVTRRSGDEQVDLQARTDTQERASGQASEVSPLFGRKYNSLLRSCPGRLELCDFVNSCLTRRHLLIHGLKPALCFVTSGTPLDWHYDLQALDHMPARRRLQSQTQALMSALPLDMPLPVATLRQTGFNWSQAGVFPQPVGRGYSESLREVEPFERHQLAMRGRRESSTNSDSLPLSYGDTATERELSGSCLDHLDDDFMSLSGPGRLGLGLRVAGGGASRTHWQNQTRLRVGAATGSALGSAGSGSRRRRRIVAVVKLKRGISREIFADAVADVQVELQPSTQAGSRKRHRDILVDDAQDSLSLSTTVSPADRFFTTGHVYETELEPTCKPPAHASEGILRIMRERSHTASISATVLPLQVTAPQFTTEPQEMLDSHGRSFTSLLSRMGRRH